MKQIISVLLVTMLVVLSGCAQVQVSNKRGDRQCTAKVDGWGVGFVWAMSKVSECINSVKQADDQAPVNKEE